MGGLSRKAYQIQQVQRQSEIPALILDSGALFFKQPRLAPYQKEVSLLTAHSIARIMQAMGTTAVGIAPHDLAAGIPFLQALSKKNDLPLLSMNLAPQQGDKKPFFSPYLLTKAGETRIAVLGLSGGRLPNQAHEEYRLLDWRTVLPDNLKAVEKQADLIILLSSLPPKENKEIAQRFRKIHIILQAEFSGGNHPPLLINNTLLCNTAPKGKYQGLLRIHWNKSQTWGTASPNQLKREQDRLDRISWQIGRMQKRHRKETLGNNSRFQQLLREQKKCALTIKNLRIQDTTKQDPCSYSYSFVPLKTTLPEDPTVKGLVEQTRRQVNQINRAIRQKQRKQQQRRRQRTDGGLFLPPLEAMAGKQSCTRCHRKQMAFYLTTSHANAWQTLAENDQQFNPDCLICHVTLPSYNKGEVQQKKILNGLPAELYAVSCESCHGPGRAHSRRPKKVRMRKPTKETCLQCHTTEHDDNFVFSQKRQKITCPTN